MNRTIGKNISLAPPVTVLCDLGQIACFLGLSFCLYLEAFIPDEFLPVFTVRDSLSISVDIESMVSGNACLKGAEENKLRDICDVREPEG